MQLIDSVFTQVSHHGLPFAHFFARRFTSYQFALSLFTFCRTPMPFPGDPDHFTYIHNAQGKGIMWLQNAEYRCRMHKIWKTVLKCYESSASPEIYAKS